MGAKWGTTAVNLSLASLTLRPIEEEIVAFKEADWAEGINTFSILKDGYLFNTSNGVVVVLDC